MITAPAPLLSRDFVLLLGATFGALANYAPLLSVVPLWASSGGAAGGWVGATTGVMMAATVLTQLAMRWILRALSLRRMLLIGSLILALATPVYALSASIAPILLVSAVRGVGFALVVVAGTALAVGLVPSNRLGTATGLYGLAAGLPNVLALPAGVWLAQTWGFPRVFIATSALALAAVFLAAAISGGDRRARTAAAARRSSTAGTAGTAGPVATANTAGATGTGRIADSLSGRTAQTPPARLSAYAAPTAVFFGTAVALGGATTFLPIAEPDPRAASAALFALSLSMVLARVTAGRIGDHVRPGRLLLPAATLGTLGMAGVAAAIATDAGPLAVVAGAAVFGLGFGAAQNDSLVAVMRQAGPRGHGTASTVWNVAYDAGVGAGAVLLGVIAAATSYAWGFAIIAAGILALAPTAWRLRRR